MRAFLRSFELAPFFKKLNTERLSKKAMVEIFRQQATEVMMESIAVIEEIIRAAVEEGVPAWQLEELYAELRFLEREIAALRPPPG